MPAAASAAAAPHAATDFLMSRPPRTKTSTVGCSARAAAVVGLWVMIVAARSDRSALTTASAVVPLSRIVPSASETGKAPRLSSITHDSA